MVSFEVGLAVMPAGVLDNPAGADLENSTGIAGFDETMGRGSPRTLASRPMLVEKGAEAVRVATEAIARQIADTAEHIAAVIEAHSISQPAPGNLGLESVDVSFGISLAGGVQAVFSSQVQSSAQVTITLSRRPQGGQPDSL